MQNMDSLISNELEEGERILWTGRPNPKSKSNTNGSLTLAFSIMAITFGFIGLLFVFIGFLAPVSSEGSSSFSGTIVFAIIGFTFLFLAFIFGLCAFVYRSNLKDTVYAITEQRIISVTAGKALAVYSYGKDEIGVLTRVEQADGTGDLIFATSRQMSPYGGYNSSGVYGGNATSSPGGIGTSLNAGKFVGIPSVREVERIVRHTFKQS